MSEARKLVTLGMFIVDEFAFLDTTGKPTGRTLSPQEEYTPRSCTRSPAYPSLYFRLGEAALMPTLALASGKVSHPPSKRGVSSRKGRTERTYGDAAFVSFAVFQLTRYPYF